MKLTLSWLKDHLDTNASVDEIAECFAELTVQRMVELRIVADAAAAADITRWLGGQG